MKLGCYQLQVLWDTGAQISVCTKPLAVKLGLKWEKPKDDLQMVTINGQKSLAVRIIENANLRILDAQVLINIHIVDSNKEELLIGSNWLVKYKVDFILSKNKLKFQA